MKYVAYVVFLLALVSTGVWLVYWKLLKVVWSWKRPFLGILGVIIGNSILIAVVALFSNAFDRLFHIYPR